MAIYSLDLSGFTCPLPLLSAKKALASLCKGERLCLQLNQYSAIEDFRLLCQTENYRLLSLQESGEQRTVVIEK